MRDVDLTGTEVARRYSSELVEPIVRRVAPGIGFVTARLGSGSDVLGLDGDLSRDHDWGCRLTLLVDEENAEWVSRISAALEAELPQTYLGLPTRFPVSWDPATAHRVQVDTVGGFAASRLGVDPTRELSTVDWLGLIGQGG